MSDENNELDAALAAIDAAAKLKRETGAATAALQQALSDLVMGRDAAAVFFANAAMRLKVEVDPAVETASTDGKRIRANPSYVVGLTRRKAVGLFAHEVMHITNKHHTRMGDRDPDKWNEACDLAINPLLREAKIELPDGALFPGEGPYPDFPPNLAAEEYYNLLQKQGQPKGGPGDGGGGGGDEDGGDGQGQGDAPDPGKCGGVEAPGKGSPAEIAKAEADADMMTAAAQQAVTASGRSDLPGGIGRAIADALEPKVDWKAVLREFVARQARNDYSWNRPNRRFVHLGLYLPGMYSDELGDVVLMLDSSGSIGDELLARFAAEMQGILDSFDCTLTVLYHHHDVYRVQHWRSTDGPLVLEEPESGGTSHVPAFKWLDDNHCDAACVVALTDLDTDFPASAPPMPVLWCKAGTLARGAPFGRVVSID